MQPVYLFYLPIFLFLERHYYPFYSNVKWFRVAGGGVLLIEYQLAHSTVSASSLNYFFGL